MAAEHQVKQTELAHAQIALFVAIALQLVVYNVTHHLLIGQYFIIPTEIALAIFIGFSINRASRRAMAVHHWVALVLLALISFANVSSLFLVLSTLLGNGTPVTNGVQLLVSAVAIFITNIIVFSLWYWEIDSPGLTRKRWSKADKDFQFTQQDQPRQFPDWQPEFFDYLYLSVTNAINFASADARPLTKAAKSLMGMQALISVFTLALVVARSVNILGS